MALQQTLGRRDHLTFKGNLKQSRHGWLRLTPAHSVHLVAELLDRQATADLLVLDPFCGTGTTALVCAERGIACDTIDINPFSVWLSQVKTHAYCPSELACFTSLAAQVARALRDKEAKTGWVPPLYQIEKWWDAATLAALSRALMVIAHLAETIPEPVINLLKVAFCRTLIERSSASFGHQSMSFKKNVGGPMLALLYSAADWAAASWEQAVAQVAATAASPTLTPPRVLLGDARDLTSQLPANHYSCVITSPPYPNRISYIRELRPYMYWLGFLSTGRAAGELDWAAIGGTWGCATSNLAKWEPGIASEIPFAEFPPLLARIAEHSKLLSRYVHKYFYDITQHCQALFEVLRPNSTLNYIVGNSKFYDVLLPVEAIYAELFRAAGFIDIDIRVIRKRTSKKELFEFLVSARKV